MYDNDRNIYKSSRQTAGITQEAAAEMLGISVESLRRYETGVSVPPNEVVDLMTIAFQSQTLGLYHLRASTATARAIIPAIQERPLSEAVLRLVNLVMDFGEQHRDRQLMRMAEDGRIDALEKPLYDEIVGRELPALIEAAMAVKYATEST